VISEQTVLRMSTWCAGSGVGTGWGASSGRRRQTSGHVTRAQAHRSADWTGGRPSAAGRGQFSVRSALTVGHVQFIAVSTPIRRPRIVIPSPAGLVNLQGSNWAGSQSHWVSDHHRQSTTLELHSSDRHL